MPKRLQFAAYSMSLLHCNGRFLMIQRSQDKRFAPGLWTGIGGRIEPDELDDMTRSALREIHEETGVDAGEISSFVARRILLQMRPGTPLTMLVYFSGEIATRIQSDSTEGKLHWLREFDLQQADVIDNTALVLPLIIRDMRLDPEGAHGPILGTAAYAADGDLRSVVWAT